MRRRTRAAARLRQPGTGTLVLSDSLDGFYRHAGCTTSWDGTGVTLMRGKHVRRLSWEDILGARQVGRPGRVQLLVSGHIPAQQPSVDPYSIPVNSDADANRLTTTLGWHARGRNLSMEGLL